jgi:hypothetical protein
MASLLTQTIGQAVASQSGLSNFNTAQQREVQQVPPTTQSVHQDLRASAEAAVITARIDSKDRPAQIPKRTEAAYSPLPHKKQRRKDPQPEDDAVDGEEQTRNQYPEMKR